MNIVERLIRDFTAEPDIKHIIAIHPDKFRRLLLDYLKTRGFFSKTHAQVLAHVMLNTMERK